jgi:hypothetical protein
MTKWPHSAEYGCTVSWVFIIHANLAYAFLLYIELFPFEFNKYILVFFFAFDIELDQFKRCVTEHCLLPNSCVGIDSESASQLTSSQKFCDSCRCDYLLWLVGFKTDACVGNETWSLPARTIINRFLLETRASEPQMESSLKTNGTGSHGCMLHPWKPCIGLHFYTSLYSINDILKALMALNFVRVQLDLISALLEVDWFAVNTRATTHEYCNVYGLRR